MGLCLILFLRSNKPYSFYSVRQKCVGSLFQLRIFVFVAIKMFFLYLIALVWVQGAMMDVEVRGQLWESVFPYHMGSPSNPAHQAWQHLPSPSEWSHRPCMFYFRDGVLLCHPSWSNSRIQAIFLTQPSECRNCRCVTYTWLGEFIGHNHMHAFSCRDGSCTQPWLPSVSWGLRSQARVTMLTT